MYPCQPTLNLLSAHFSTSDFELFKNTKEFLKEQIKAEQLIRAFDNSTEALTHIWKTKYAKKRIESLIALSVIVTGKQIGRAHV